MSIKHFNYGSYNINDDFDEDVLNDSDAIKTESDELNEYDNKQKRKIEQKYHKYERYGIDKLYVPLATGILLIGVCLSKFVDNSSVILISTIALIVVYILAILLLKYKKQKCIDQLGYVPKPKINKVHQLFNKMKGE